jgi:uncharacterized protein GlcG (DUF336 family)
MPKTRSINVITIDAALEAVNAALSEAKKLDLKLSVAVVNPELNLIAFARADGAPPQSIEQAEERQILLQQLEEPQDGWKRTSILHSQWQLATSLPTLRGVFQSNLQVFWGEGSV